MAIPKYNELTWPILEILKDGQPRSTDELAKILADRFALTEEERNALIPSGVQTYIMNRTSWACIDLKSAGLLTRPKRGCWQATPEGLKVASGPPRKLDRHALSEYPSFAEYLARARGKANAAAAELAQTGDSTDVNTRPRSKSPTRSRRSDLN